MRVIVLYLTCRILNCNFWLQLTDNSSTEEEVYSVQQAALVKVFDRHTMEILKSYTEADGRHSFHAVTRYTYKYFDLVM